MNERQKTLVWFLTFQTGYVKQETISKYVSYYTTHESDFHNTAERIMMTNDIRAINDSQEFDGIILSNKNGVKLASTNDIESSLKSEYIDVLKALKRVRRKLMKYNLDGQAFLTDELTEDFKDVFKGA